MAKVRLEDVAAEARETWNQDRKDVPVVGLEHLEPDEIWLRQWNVNPDENTFTKGFKKGQLLFGRRRAYQKKMSLAPCDGICSGDITVIAARPEKIVPELLPFYLRTDGFFDFAMRGSGGSLSPRVKWSHISAARVIVEAGLKGYHIDPSQGTHFFQNLTSFGVGYFTINTHVGDGVYQKQILDAMPAVEETEYVRHVRFEQPLRIMMDGKKQHGLVLLP